MALSLDASCFRPEFSSADTNTHLLEQSSFDGLREFYLLRNGNALEQLSIKNVNWCLKGSSLKRFPISQGMLIKTVRSHSTLRWLLSDLSAKNVALLQQESPQIIFISD
jgi:hypothetical protein